MLSRSDLKALAHKVGFDLCGVARCRHLTAQEGWFRAWLAQGYHSSLGYMERHIEKRFDPSLLVERATTAVVCAVSVKNRFSDGYPDEWPAKIASYACAEDYHTTLRAMLQEMLVALREQHPRLQGRAFVDTAPLAEKQLAVEAGLGWIGKQSLLVTPEYGTFVSLGELILCEECDDYDTPFEGSRCGSCRVCLDACPTGALVAPQVVNTRRCIACHTIEREPDDEIDLHGWIFGCDACQQGCPWNRRAPQHRLRAFDPVVDPLTLTPERWRSMTPEEFDAQMGCTPMTRSGLDRIKGNIKFTIHNSQLF